MLMGFFVRLMRITADLSAPIGDDEWSRADKSAVGTVNWPLRPIRSRSLTYKQFMHPEIWHILLPYVQQKDTMEA